MNSMGKYTVIQHKQHLPQGTNTSAKEKCHDAILHPSRGRRGFLHPFSVLLLAHLCHLTAQGRGRHRLLFQKNHPLLQFASSIPPFGKIIQKAQNPLFLFSKKDV